MLQIWQLLESHVFVLEFPLNQQFLYGMVDKHTPVSCYNSPPLNFHLKIK